MPAHDNHPELEDTEGRRNRVPRRRGGLSGNTQSQVQGVLPGRQKHKEKYGGIQG